MSLLDAWPTMGLTSETMLFSITATIIVACALGVLFFKKVAHVAISMASVMPDLAVLYITEQAPFLGIVQVVVYTGAIMMLFLFVIMMIDIDATDDYATQSKSLIVAAILVGLGLAVVIISAITYTTLVSEAVGFEPKNPYSDEPITVLVTMFSFEYWLTMRVARALLITAAIGVMLLTHSDALGPKIPQRGTAKTKMRAFAETKRHIGQLPAPGVYAHSNAAGAPVILGETLAPVEESALRVIRVYGSDHRIKQVDPEVTQLLVLAYGTKVIDSSFVPEAPAMVPPSDSWGIPGSAALSGLDQPLAPSIKENATSASIQEEEK